MQIQLKQREIEDALRGYIIKQGITLKGRTLAISFVSGRKENGLTADLCIEDAPIPGFTGEEDEPPHHEGEEDPTYRPVASTQCAPLETSPEPVSEPDVSVSVTELENAPASNLPGVTDPMENSIEVQAAPVIKPGVSLFN